MKKIFLTFADQRLQPSIDRIVEQAQSMNFYDEIIALNETNLDTDFRIKFNNKLIYGTTGFGWMCWKPQVILQTLYQMDDGDILQWTDVDVHLNPGGVDRLQYYFDQVNQSPTGVQTLEWILPDDPLLLDGIIEFDQTERMYTKGDLFDYFGVRNRPDITDTEQIANCVVWVRKCAKSLEMIKQWAQVPHDNFNLQDDSPSISENFSDFRCHKHDQSVLSIICKLNGVKNISFYECNWPTSHRPGRVKVSFDKLTTYPIHCKNDKQFNKMKTNIPLYNRADITVVIAGDGNYAKYIEHAKRTAEELEHPTLVYDLGGLGFGQPFHGSVSNTPLQTIPCKPSILLNALDKIAPDAYLCWLDADALMLDRIDEIAYHGHFDIGVTIRKKPADDDRVSWINAGVVFVKNTSAAKEFINHWIDEATKLNGDQWALNNLCNLDESNRITPAIRFGATIKTFPCKVYNNFTFKGNQPEAKIKHYKSKYRHLYPYSV